MKKNGRHLFFVFVAALTIAGGLPVMAQTVVTDDAKVVVDGNNIRIETAEGVTVVQDGWRQAGAGDTEQILIDLGAVTVEDRIQITLGEAVLFDFGSYAIRPDAAASLTQVAQVIRGRAVGTVYVMGHTDSIGEDATNRELSRQRAAAVMSWLNRHEGIPARIMVGSGMGSTRPVAHNTHPDGSDYPEGRARNRRVEIQMATREGVRVGPAVVIGPGGVKVDESGVSVAGGVIEIDEDSVRVGGIEVTNEGVHIGGTAVKMEGGDPVLASGGDTIRAGCVFGDCAQRCETGDSCSFTCQGGDCTATCEPGSTCSVGCPGGDCKMVCEPGAVCDFSCPGGDCEFRCLQGADCRRVTCYGEGCVCVGPAC